MVEIIFESGNGIGQVFKGGTLIFLSQGFRPDLGKLGSRDFDFPSQSYNLDLESPVPIINTTIPQSPSLFQMLFPEGKYRLFRA